MEFRLSLGIFGENEIHSENYAVLRSHSMPSLARAQLARHGSNSLQSTAGSEVGAFMQEFCIPWRKEFCDVLQRDSSPYSARHNLHSRFSVSVIAGRHCRLLPSGANRSVRPETKKAAGKKPDLVQQSNFAKCRFIETD